MKTTYLNSVPPNCFGCSDLDAAVAFPFIKSSCWFSRVSLQTSWPTKCTDLQCCTKHTQQVLANITKQDKQHAIKTTLCYSNGVCQVTVICEIRTKRTISPFSENHTKTTQKINCLQSEAKKKILICELLSSWKRALYNDPSLIISWNGSDKYLECRY